MRTAAGRRGPVVRTALSRPRRAAEGWCVSYVLGEGGPPARARTYSLIQGWEWEVQVQTPSGNQSAISFSAFSTESEPWQMLRPTWMQ